MAEESEQFNLAKEEEKILEFWEKKHVFEKSLELRKSGKEFVFYEGPPGANGKPGIHHVISRVFKDIILRYKTMRGFSVPRKSGWDTHGLPVELSAEKELGLTSKKDIEKFGIAKFNRKCQELVWQYKSDWEKLTERIGFWLDLKHPYVTYDKNYIESLFWIVKQIWKKGLLYEGHKVVPWCTRCGTSLSSHELALGYKEVVDTSIYAKFKLTAASAKRLTKGKLPVYVLSWTTTPWTLPGNVALAIGKDIKYVMTFDKAETEVFIVAQDLFAKLFGLDGKTKLYGFPLVGKDLIGLEYEPLFNVASLRKKAAYKIYPADFVTTTDGTGVVHTAVMYGEDDYNLGKEVGLPQHHTVDEVGKFTKDVAGFAGLYVKAKKTEEAIIGYLQAKNFLFKTEAYTHEYPHCWRCSTPLLYYARTSWFIAMSKLRNKLIASNDTINWTPEHVKEGRFGEWLKDVKDWNFSRARYWGTPLPVWRCGSCAHEEVLGSLSEIHDSLGGARNEYWTMRHGEGENNIFHIINSKAGSYHLTPKGEKEADQSATKLLASLKGLKKKIDVVISSDLTRTAETAKRAAKILGVKRVILNKQLREIQLGELSGCHDMKYHELYPTYRDKFERTPLAGESLRDLRARMWGALQSLEKQYRGKRILLVSHEYPIWMMHHAARGWNEEEAIAEKEKRGDDFIHTGSIEKLDVLSAPRNETGEVDLHRPYIDEVIFPCAKCKGGKMKRLPEVVDVWYDSGAMPFAQAHYPFAQIANRKSQIVNPKGASQFALGDSVAYPADYICEAVDQTRGWFYTLVAVATLLGLEAPFKNVISLGLIHDKHGQKMSKSKGNVVDPLEMINKYGVDAVRWYFYTMNPPGEPKNFDEAELGKTYRRFHLILWNSYVFYRTYADKGEVRNRKKETRENKNLLDQWILSRLDETIAETTKNLENYNIREAAISIEQLVDDLSRWYIRRSRRRLQPARRNLGEGGKSTNIQADFLAASTTLGHVLREIAKLIAPFTPFFAEKLFGELKRETGNKQQDVQSVHLENWSEGRKSQIANRETNELLNGMEEVRRIAALGLAKRAEVGIKVRQPLANLKVKSKMLNGKSLEDLLEILKDEVNVKNIVIDESIEEEIELDTNVTPELKEEGTMRDLVRMVSELRGKANLKPKDEIVLSFECGEPAHGIVERNEKLLKKEVGAKTVNYKKTPQFDAEIDGKLDDQSIWIGLKKT